MGLANQAYTDEELLPKTMELAKKIAKKSPVAVKAALRCFNIQSHPPIMKASKRKPIHSEMFSFLKMQKKESKHLLKNVNLYLKENNRKLRRSVI